MHPQISPVFISPAPWFQMQIATPTSLCSFWGYKLGFSHLQGKYFTNWTISEPSASHPFSTINSSFSCCWLVLLVLLKCSLFSNSVHPGPKGKVAGIHFLFRCTMLYFLFNVFPSLVVFIQSWSHLFQKGKLGSSCVPPETFIQGQLSSFCLPQFSFFKSLEPTLVTPVSHLWSFTQDSLVSWSI